jgi:uncharacterized protein (DUF2147 family)
MKRSESFLKSWILPKMSKCRRGAVILLLLGMAAPLTRATAATPVTNEVWLMDAKVAVQLFDCGDLLCGRIVWLVIPRDAQGVLTHDERNPNVALRERPLCGLTVLWGLHPKGADRWEDGWFYNPYDGKTYRVSAKLTSADAIVARVYHGIPLFGETKTLQRVPHGKMEGWC